jgi:threonine/homoserine/homoserine lactone efflux protein
LAEAKTKPPLQLWHVAGFQFVNPKAWMMTVSAVSIYGASAQDYGARLLLVAATFIVVSAPCIAVWAAFGAGMKSALKEPHRLKLFNRAMAALTVLSAALVLLWA